MAGGQKRSAFDEAWDAANSEGASSSFDVAWQKANAPGGESDAQTEPRGTPQPQSMFTEPDPSMQAPDARGTLEQLIDPEGKYGQAVADAGGDPIRGMVDAHGGPNAMLEEFLSMVSPGGGGAAAATEKATAEGVMPILRKVFGGAALGGVGGGAIRASDAHQAGADDQEVLEQFVSGFAPGAITGGGLAAFGALGGRAGLSLEKSAAANADWTLLRSTGLTAQEVQKLGADERGALAQKLRDSGMTDGFAPSMRTINDRATGLMKSSGAQMSGAEDAINALDNPPNVPVSDLIAEQRAKADVEAQLAPPGKRAAAAYRRGVADNLSQDLIRTTRAPANDEERFQWLAKGGQPTAYEANDMPWDRALQQRRAFDDETNFGATNQTESNQNAINKQFGGGLRDRIDTALNSPNVPPELAQDWRTGRDNFSLASDVADSSLRGMPNNQGYIPTSASEAAAQAAGFLNRNGGMAALSSLSSGAAGIGNFGQRMGMSAANEAGRIGQGVASATEQMQQVQGQSRGQMQPQIVESLLDSNPQAFGPYAQPLMQARKDGTLNQKLTQLRNTDDVWQRQFLPQLQQMSAQAP